MKIHGVAPMLVVRDIDRSAKFYAEVLGFKVASNFTPEGRKSPSWASLRRDGVEVMLTAPEAAPAGARDCASLYVYVDDLEGVQERARSAGTDASGPFVRFYGLKELELRDPDGFLVIVAAASDEAPTPER
jgi:predicted enzyme related to lactoylglutathione lyase